MEKKIDFEKLNVYQKAIKFVNTCFELSNNFSTKVQFSLGDQLRRAALSIITNIAEGSGRRHVKEKKQFYQTSLSSCFECIAIITICLSGKQITQDEFNSLYTQCLTLSKMLSGLIKSVNELSKTKN